ncbi:MAG: hypothetical protein ACK4M9_22525, partial [Anaerobacillus sp.]|uniref:hypothetical protein n=1 Tax=Anaerobacillus sp. TaxID=1872506 RepID=UPI00391B1C2A
TVPPDLNYEKHPTDHYGWDTIHKWIEIDGIRPKLGNAVELTAFMVYSIWQQVNNAIAMFTIFLLQFGFSEMDFLDDFISNIHTTMQPLRDYVFNNGLSFALLFLAAIVIIKYGQGRIGEAFVVILKALVYSALVFLVIDNVDWVIRNIDGFMNYVAMFILGLLSLSPITGQTAVEIANTQVIQVSNILFRTYIENPWVYGQFASLEAPMLSGAEINELRKTFDVSGWTTWRDANLAYPTGGEERLKMIDIMRDDSITHSAELDIKYFSSSAFVRLMLVGLTGLSLMPTTILYAGTASFLFLSKVGVILIAILLPFLVMLSFLGGFGERALRKTLGIWINLFSWVIAAALFIGIPILITNIIDVSELNIFVALIILMLVNAVGVLLMPAIVLFIAPGVQRVAGKVLTAGRRHIDRKRGGSANYQAPRISPDRRNFRKFMDRRSERKRHTDNATDQGNKKQTLPRKKPTTKNQSNMSKYRLIRPNEAVSAAKTGIHIVSGNYVAAGVEIGRTISARRAQRQSNTTKENNGTIDLNQRRLQRTMQMRERQRSKRRN